MELMAVKKKSDTTSTLPLRAISVLFSVLLLLLLSDIILTLVSKEDEQWMIED
jgi:hypothetical protein